MMDMTSRGSSLNLVETDHVAAAAAVLDGFAHGLPCRRGRRVFGVLQKHASFDVRDALPPEALVRPSKDGHNDGRNPCLKRTRCRSRSAMVHDSAAFWKDPLMRQGLHTVAGAWESRWRLCPTCEQYHPLPCVNRRLHSAHDKIALFDEHHGSKRNAHGR